MPTPRALAVIAAGMATLVGAAAPAQQQEPQPRFVDSIEVRVVNLDVVVTDADGVPVTDLTRDDFTLLVNGEPRPLTNFLNLHTAADATPPAAAVPPTTEAAPEAGMVPTPPPLRLIVAVDLFNLERLRGNWVFKQIEEFLATRPAGVDEVAVVVLDERLRVRCPPTTDMARVKATLDEVSRESPRGILYETNRRITLQALSNARRPEEALGIARSHAMEVASRSRQSLNELATLVTAFAAPEGRTVLVLLSDGFQLRAGEDIFERVAGRFSNPGEVLAEAQSWDLSADMERLVAAANAAGVTFYAFEAAGLKPPPMAVADTARPVNPMFAFTEQNTRRDPLERLPEATGGFAVIGRNKVDALVKEMAAELRSCYWLGFEPRPGDGAGGGRIEVRVTRPGLTVRHRESFRELSPQERLENGVTAALNGALAGNRLGVSVNVTSVKRVKRRTVQAEITVRIPSAQLVMIPDGDVAAGRIEVAASALDRKGRSAPIVRQSGTVSLPADAVTAGAPVEIPFTILLRAERQTIAVGVRDESGGEPSYVVVEIDGKAARS